MRILADPQHGWTVGLLPSHSQDGSVVVGTSDGGDTWATRRSSDGDRLYAVACLGADQARAVGAEASGGFILASSDSGTSWHEQLTVRHDPIRHVAFVDAAHGWAATCRGRLLQTGDGGRHWQASLKPPGFTATGMAPVDARRCWLVGMVEGQNPGRLFVGDARTATMQRFEEGNPHGIVTYGQSRVGVFGNGVPLGGEFWSSADDGAHWTRADLFAESPYGVVFSDALRGWAVGYDGTIARTSDGGLSWTVSHPRKGTSALLGIACLRSGRVAAADRQTPDHT